MDLKQVIGERRYAEVWMGVAQSVSDAVFILPVTVINQVSNYFWGPVKLATWRAAGQSTSAGIRTIDKLCKIGR